MNARRTSRTIGLLLSGLLVSPVFAQTAGMLSFQGLIKDGGGNPMTGTVDLEFRIFDAQTAGDLVDMDGDGVVEDVCGEDVTCVSTVTVTDGILSTKFGPVSPKAFDGNLRWLEVSVDGSPLSRIEMATAPGASEQVNIPASGTPAINVDAAGNVGIGTTEPGTRKLQVNGDVQATTYHGDGSNLIGIERIPSGIIVMWSGTRATIPPGWVLCDGTNGTPDLQERFIYGILNKEDPGTAGGFTSHTHSEEYPDRRWRVLSNDQYWNSGTVDCDVPWCLPDYDPTPLVVNIEDEGASVKRIIKPPGPSVGSLSNVEECFPDANICSVVPGEQRRIVTWHRAYKQGMSTENHLPTYYKLAFIMKL